ncbi:casein kinase I [Trichoderma austrokoningii]
MSGHHRNYTGTILQDRWFLEGIIGSGGFGQVYLATDLLTDNVVAVKTCYTKPNSTRSATEGTMQHEALFYKLLSNQPGIAALHELGFDNSISFEFMVCDLLGPSLLRLVNRCGYRFSLKTTLMLADQLIPLVEMLHSKNIMHRDLKMENIVMGLGRENGKRAYILDFGLSGLFQPRGDYLTAPPYRMAGTTDTACIAWHLKRAQSPKDDLESLAYTFIYLLRGYLPWTTDDDSSFETPSSERALKMKLSLPVEIICKDLPSEFARHLKYVRSLKYGDVPNYGKIRDMYRRLMQRMGYQYDGVYDWDLKDGKGNVVRQPVCGVKPVYKENSALQSDPLTKDTPGEQAKSFKRRMSDAEANNQQDVAPPVKKRRIIFKKATAQTSQRSNDS